MESVPSFLALFAVGLVICGFIGFGLLVLLLHRGRRLSRVLLAAFFIAWGLTVLDVALQVGEVYLRYPGGAYWLAGLPLVMGPLLYLLTRSVLESDYRWRWRKVVHFVPFLLVLLFAIFNYHLRPTEYQLEFLRRSREASGGAGIASSVLAFAHLGTYLALALRRLYRYRRALEGRFSNLAGRGVRWLERVLYGYLTVLVLSVGMQYLASGGAGRELLLVALMVLVVVMLAMMVASAYVGLRESDVFGGLTGEEVGGGARVPAETEPAVTTEHTNHITTYLQRERPFLNADLTLAQLAEQIDLPPRELSHRINRGLGCSFFDLINGHRIRHAQHLLATSDDPGLTVLEVMYRAGFNSKSSFNTAFKKHTGLTPTQWRRKNTDS